MNDIDDAIEDVKWIKEHGLRGGVLHPAGAARRARLHPAAERSRVRPAVGGVPGPRRPDQLARRHRRRRSTRTSRRRRSCTCRSSTFYTQRTLNWLVLSGVFERFPRLKFVLTEQGGGWVGDAAKQPRRADQERAQRLDRRAALHRRHGAAASRERVHPPERVARRELRQSSGTSSGATSSPRATGCGGATSRTTRRRRRSPGSTCASAWRACPPRRSASCSRATRPRSTTSTSPRSTGRRRRSGRRSRSSTRPLDEMPENPNMALRGAGNTVGRARG